jgi:multisubunit Na+/H+ antiporter MnhB subunit
MDLRLDRLRRGEVIAAAGGVLLLFAMFLDWYAAGGAGGVRLRGSTAWQSFAVLDVILALVALLAILLAALAATQRSPALPVAASVVTAATGILTALLVLYRILDQPGPNELVEVKLGAFLGFLCVLAVAAGGWDAMSEDNSTAGTAAADPASTRPTPPATGPPEPAAPPEAEPRA